MPIKSIIALQRQLFCPRQNFVTDKNPTMENLPGTKKLGLTSGFSLGRHGGLGGGGGLFKMRMIGNSRYIKGLNQVTIYYVSL